ncbi:hypothetical protein ABK040_001548 [Willaertia magna]
MSQNLDNIKFDFSKINIPQPNTPVHKEECCLSFDTPKSEGGLNICLNTFLAFSPKFVRKHFELTGNSVYLNIKKIRKEKSLKEKAEQEDEKEKPTKVAIGVEGGFQLKEEEENDDNYEELHSLVLLEPNNLVIGLPNNNLPEKVKLSIKGILESQSVERKKEVVQWEGEALKESTYALTLKQIGERKVPASNWKCDCCDITDNLWLNLTDGHIGCGRKFWDGTGGNNHAVEHYQQSGFPLCVKLGTIHIDENNEPKADVYSYAEDAMVKDPKLIEHLEYFGINITEMKKTSKTMAELELDQNMSFDFTRIQESDKLLTPVFGSGFTGLKNIGNSCYLASTMQTLFSIPEFAEKYFDKTMRCYTSTSSIDNFSTQISKLAYGLLSGDYSKEEIAENGEPKAQEGIPPRSFKSVVGKGHPEFSTMRQQDAVEFYQYLLQLIEREDKRLGTQNSSVINLFNYKVEERIQCSESSKVKYTYRSDNIVSLPVPLEAAINKEEYEAYRKQEKEREEREKEEKKKIVENVNSKPIAGIEEKRNVVRPKVPMSKCIESLAQIEPVENFYSSALQRKTLGLKRTRFSTFPDYLVVQVRRFILDGWVPKKLDVFITDPEEIDISSLRGTGLLSGEENLPEESGESQTPKIYINEEMVQQLMDMGIPENRAKRGVMNTNNSGVEAALSWVFEHAEDADIDNPISGPTESASNVSESGIEALEGMGFPRNQAIVALKQTDNNVERAIEWLFSHQDDIHEYLKNDDKPKEKKEEKVEHFTDGNGKYELVAFISHIGTNTSCGHYVCHIKKDIGNGNKRWVLFNDSKVALSENPPFDMGYMYIYKRK